MPKANKHAEVKPSKFKTSLCQFFLKDGECKFGDRCVFAHGEHELQSEAANVELLRATGLQRLDRGPAKAAASAAPRSTTPSLSESSSVSAPRSPVTAAAPTPAPAAAPRRRQPVMVSLPKQSAGYDRFCSPYAAAYSSEDIAYRQFSRNPTASVGGHATGAAAAGTAGAAAASRCHCGIGSTCEGERPQSYRHNPYRAVGVSMAC